MQMSLGGLYLPLWEDAHTFLLHSLDTLGGLHQSVFQNTTPTALPLFLSNYCSLMESTLSSPF